MAQIIQNQKYFKLPRARGVLKKHHRSFLSHFAEYVRYYAWKHRSGRKRRRD